MACRSSSRFLKATTSIGFPIFFERKSAKSFQLARSSSAVSEPTNYGFVDRITTSDGTGIPGGVGGGAGYDGHAIFYVGVPDVEAALRRAEGLGGKRLMGPVRAPTGLVVGHFTDPEGHLVGVAGPN